MAHECDFSPRVTLVAIDKAFKRSPQEGLQAIGLELDNLKTRAEEIFWPKDADFRVDFKEKNGRLFWKRYTRPIVHCLMRGISLLKHDGADPEKVRQEEVVLEVFKLLEPQLLELKNGGAIQSLALRDINPTAGVSFVQFERKNGRLIGRYKLLPFEELDQIAKFTNLIEEKGDKLDLGIELEKGLSPLLTWAVKGRAINFKKELPEIVERTMESVVPELVIERPVEMRPWRTWEWMRPELSLLTPESIRQRDSVDVHLGSGYEEVRVTEVPKYEALMVAAPVASDFRIEERITEVTRLQAPGALATGGQAELTESTEKVVVPTVVFSESHPRGGVEVVTEKIGAPSVVAPVLIVNELQTWEDTEVIEGVEKVVALAVTRMIPVTRESVTEKVPERLEVTVTKLPTYGEVSVSQSVEAEKVVEPVMTRMILVSDISMPGVIEHDRIELVKLPQPVATIQVEKHKEHKSVKTAEIFVAPQVTRMIPVSREITVTEWPKTEDVVTEKISVPSDDSVVSVTEEASGIEVDDWIEEAITERTELTEGTEGAEKEVFNGKITKFKSISSTKDEVAWLQRQIANVVADGLIGRRDDPMAIYGWLINGLAMMRFDRVENRVVDEVIEGQKRRWLLGPTRILADQVVGMVKQMKERFIQASLGVYKHIFAYI